MGDSAFFAHRTGEYNRRRCLSTEEMIAQGYASERLLVKMYLENKPIREEHDVWYIIADREAVRKAFGRVSPTEDEDEE